LKIYQIFYDEVTRANLDSAFIAFDNTLPKNKDWYEYSVIREVILNNTFSDDEYIGFLSPKFTLKTGLTGVDVTQLLNKSNAEVISFSSEFHQIAIFKNPFEQGDFFHKGMLDLSKKILKEIGLNIDLDNLVTDQSRTIFSHYFVAKYSFWLKYLTFSEKIFSISQEDSELGRLLNKKVLYKKGKRIPLKVFLMERLITAVLTHFDINAEIGLSYQKIHQLQLSTNKFPINKLLTLEAFKTAYLKTNKPYYMYLYSVLSDTMPKNNLY
jgi:hypothetical protein